MNNNNLLLCFVSGPSNLNTIFVLKNAAKQHWDTEKELIKFDSLTMLPKDELRTETCILRNFYKCNFK